MTPSSSTLTLTCPSCRAARRSTAMGNSAPASTPLIRQSTGSTTLPARAMAAASNASSCGASASRSLNNTSMPIERGCCAAMASISRACTARRQGQRPRSCKLASSIATMAMSPLAGRALTQPAASCTSRLSTRGLPEWVAQATQATNSAVKTPHSIQRVWARFSSKLRIWAAPF